MNTKGIVLTAIIASVTLTGCVIGNQSASNGSNASVTLGNVEVYDGQQAGHVSSVNGNVEIGSNTVVKSAETVNGNVEVGNNSQTRSLSTVNGSVTIGDNTIVDGKVSTVNGEIVINSGAKVKRDVRITNGEVIVKNSAIVSGNIVFEHTNFSGMFNSRFERTLIIEPGAVVEGKIVLYTPVKLDLPEDFDRTKIDNRVIQKK